MGSRRIGVAVSDDLCITAQPLKYIDAGKPNDHPADIIVELCKQYKVEEIVIGMPLSMSGGDRGLSCRRAKALGDKLQSLLSEKPADIKPPDIKIAYVDERFTTAQAQRLLISGKVRRKNRKEVVDKIAAALILQGYLDGRKNEPC